MAIDPRNGEVLAFVSGFHLRSEPVRRWHRRRRWKELNESIDKPLLNRAIRGTYAPGSTYKPYMALAALTLQGRAHRGVGQLQDPGHYTFGNHVFHDDVPQGHGFVDMYQSIVKSCDIYYFALANDIGVDTIAGFADVRAGQPTGIDLQERTAATCRPPTGSARPIAAPTPASAGTPAETISLGIGQGYNSFTITQLANALATLSTGGRRHTPHLVRDVVDVVSGARHPVAPTPLPPLALKPEFVDVIRNAMVGVNKEGTGAAAFANAGYLSGGKTGTAQVAGIKANEKYNWAGRTPARQRVVHRLRAGRAADDRNRDGGRERRFRRPVRGMVARARDGLLDRDLPDRRGHRRRRSRHRRAAEDGQGAGGAAAPGRNHAARAEDAADAAASAASAASGAARRERRRGQRRQRAVGRQRGDRRQRGQRSERRGHGGACQRGRRYRGGRVCIYAAPAFPMDADAQLRKAQQMIVVVERPTIGRLRPVLLGYDPTLMIAVLLICAINGDDVLGRLRLQRAGARATWRSRSACCSSPPRSRRRT